MDALATLVLSGIAGLLAIGALLAPLVAMGMTRSSRRYDDEEWSS